MVSKRKFTCFFLVGMLGMIEAGFATPLVFNFTNPAFAGGAGSGQYLLDTSGMDRRNSGQTSSVQQAVGTTIVYNLTISNGVIAIQNGSGNSINAQIQTGSGNAASSSINTN